MDNRCPVCSSDKAKEDKISGKGLVFQHTCPRCGIFDMDVDFRTSLSHMLANNHRKISVLSHWIRSRHEANTPDESGRSEMILLDQPLVETIIKQRPPKPAEQANNLILWLGNNAETYDEFLSLEPVKDLSLIGSVTSVEFVWVTRHLIDSGTIEGTITSGDLSIRLSFSGWEYFEELKRGALDSRKAFMAMEYGDEQLDSVVEDVFKPAVKQTGFGLFKLVDRPKAGLIDDRLRVEIRTSRFLIADLSHENAGAYWEAGYAEGLGKPVIYTCEKDKFEKQKTHFDTNHHLTVLWHADNPSEAAEELKATIRATLPGEAKLTDE